MSAVLMILILSLFLLDPDAREDLIRHDWADRIFRALVHAVGLWFIVGFAFLVAALFIKKAKILGLFGLILFNVLIMFGAWDESYGIGLIIPLCLSLICLGVEEYRAIVYLRRETA